MYTTALSQLEKGIDQLSFEEQLLLMEKLAQRIRERAAFESRRVENDLAAMANDPEIQRELREIEREFAYAESDGLDDL